MFLKAVLENRLDVVNFLIDNGMTPQPGAHLLHAASEKGFAELMRIMLKYYPVDDRDDRGNTPLHLAGTVEAAQLLLDAGAAVDARNDDRRFPHETAPDADVCELLKARYDAAHPPRVGIPPAASAAPAEGAEDWEHRFTLEQLSMRDLVPVEDENDPEQARIVFNDTEYRLSKRFYASLARKLKFSTNVFKYFSPREFLTRISEREQDLRFQATFDNGSRELLGVTDPDKKLLPAHLACQVIADDPRTKSIAYNDGVWEAELMLDEKFNVPKAGDYYRRLQIRYPVDGISAPSIYLAHMRVICSNGAVAAVASFRTEIEVNDESGMHLGKLLKSFSNDYGFSAMTERLAIAQDTAASVGELLGIDALIAANVGDKDAYRKIHDRLNDIAGDPCYQYGVTSLQSIPRKRQALLPVKCSVNDLLNVCSELTTHYGELLHRPRAFDEKMGQMLSQEFDLEGMYHSHNGNAPDFFLNDLGLGSRHRAGESVERRRNLVVAR